MAKNQGKHQHRRGSKGRHRGDGPHNYWRHAAHPADIGREEFRVLAILGRKHGKPKRAWVTGLVTQVEWDDVGAILQGSVTLEQPERALPRTTGKRKGKPPYKLDELPFGYGDRIRLFVRRLGHRRWHKVWEMQVTRDSDLTVPDGTLTLSLADPLDRLKHSFFDWSFTSNDQHPHGWQVAKIARRVAHEADFRLGEVARSNHKVKKLVRKDTSAYDCLVEAYQRVRDGDGKRYVMAARSGRLNIERERRPAHMIVIGKFVANATKTWGTRGNFSTRLVARARIGGKGKGKDKGKGRQEEVTVTSKKFRGRAGLIQRFYHPDGGADSKAELRKKARREMERSHKPRRELTFTHPGMVGLRRGDSCMVVMPELGLKRLIYVKEVRHIVSAADYTMEVTAGWSDPYRVKDHHDRKDKADKHHRPSDRNDKRGPAARPYRAERRSDLVEA